MAWTTYQKALAVVMMITGSINTLSTKWADKLTSVGYDGGKSRPFDHPFFQACGMFLGELSCLLVYHIIRIKRGEESPKFNPLIFLPAACCDMCGTSLMYFGLNYTFASSFQMLRGAVIIFTAFLSVAFLGKTIKSHMWLGMFAVLVGLVVVGLSDFVFPVVGKGGSDDKASDTNGVIAGDLMIIMGQVIVAVQMVYEEKFITKYNVPALQAVGWEGFFGLLCLGLLQIPFYFIQIPALRLNDPTGRLENVPDAIIQLGNNWQLILAFLGNVFSIAFFNFSGISVTKEMSATTRMVLDSMRTLVIWVITLALGWLIFNYLQVIGFIVLCVGMCLYNDILFRPLMNKCRGNSVELGEAGTSDEREHLVDDRYDRKSPSLQAVDQ